MKNFDQITIADEDQELYEEFYEECASYSICELTDQLHLLEEQPDDNLVQIKAIRDRLKEMDIDYNVYNAD
jgi:hypothetical protein